MAKELVITYQNEMDSQHLEAVIAGLSAHAHAKKGLGPAKLFSFTLTDEEGVFQGGICGITYYGCLYIDLLHINETLRGQGYGTQLINKAETLGRERGCSFATVHTMEWQARELYEKLGYEVEFVREGYDRGTVMYLMRKPL